MCRLKILVADDSRTARVHVERTLCAAGFDVLMAEDGVEAVQLIHQDPPDLAILDINMPRLDGYGVCEELQRMGSDLPVIFLTSVRANALQLLGHEMGAYLQKPALPDQLLHTVRTFLSVPAA